MRLLLDENLPHRLRTEILGHEVITTAYMGWSGIENGELLRRAAAESFDGLVTNDRGLEYEQNQKTLPLAVIVLIAETNTIESLRRLLPQFQLELQTIKPGELVTTRLAANS